MNQRDASKLLLGIYRLHWKEGGWSLAAVGCHANGQRWFAPCNWISGVSTQWSRVDSAERIDLGLISKARDD